MAERRIDGFRQAYMAEKADRSYMKYLRGPPLQLEDLDCAALLSRELWRQHHRWPSSCASGRGPHQRHLDFSQAFHRLTGGSVRSERDLRQAHEHQPENGREGVQAQRPIGPLVRWPPGDDTAFLARSPVASCILAQQGKRPPDAEGR